MNAYRAAAFGWACFAAGVAAGAGFMIILNLVK